MDESAEAVLLCGVVPYPAEDMERERRKAKHDKRKRRATAPEKPGNTTDSLACRFC